MQYTLRNVPSELDAALRERARRQGKSINQVLLEIVAAGLGLGDEPVRMRSLSDISGSWVEDPATEAALADQRKIDEDLWT